MKRIVNALALASLFVFVVGGAAFACGKACPMKAADKGGCPMGAKDSPAMQSMEKAFTALQADLAVLDKGVPATSQAAFLTGTQANLKALMDGKAECEKACKAQADKAGKAEKAAMKACPHHDAMQAGMKSLSEDLAKLEKGVAAPEQAAFLKGYHTDLKRVLDTHAACLKQCKAKAAKTDKT